MISSIFRIVALENLEFLALSSKLFVKSLIVWLLSSALLMWYFNAAPAVASFRA
ncbi:hypothetical protein [Helicobacter pylori]|uniref:hypothetical protein n=1 Tax=Helicobacter pylori TaxID=210 RepID=UPI00356231A2